jgi:hypothetical protein
LLPPRHGCARRFLLPRQPDLMLRRHRISVT